MISALTLRRLALAGSGLTFGSIALASLVAPATVARTYGLSANSVDGLSEIRAVFTGFWLALAFAMLTAARRPEHRLLGDVCGIMIGTQALGRVLSLVVDGRPSIAFVGAMLGELVTAALILAPRLSTSVSTSAPQARD
jgi:hypothetical protein